MKYAYIIMAALAAYTLGFCVSGCSSIALRNGDCEFAYTRSFQIIDGLQGDICGASGKADKIKVDSEGIEATTSPIGTIGLGVTTGGAIDAVAPVLPTLVK